MLFKILQRKMNEKIKKVFASIGVFTSLLCVFGISLYNNRNGTKTTERKQSDYKEPIRNIEDRSCITSRKRECVLVL